MNAADLPVTVVSSNQVFALLVVVSAANTSSYVCCILNVSEAPEDTVKPYPMLATELT